MTTRTTSKDIENALDATRPIVAKIIAGRVARLPASTPTIDVSARDYWRLFSSKAVLITGERLGCAWVVATHGDEVPVACNVQDERQSSLTKRWGAMLYAAGDHRAAELPT